MGEVKVHEKFWLGLQLRAWNFKPWTDFHILSISRLVDLGTLVILVQQLGQSNNYGISFEGTTRISYRH